MQLVALEGADVPPLVLPPDVEQWLDEALDAARAAPPPALPLPALLAPPPSAQQAQQQWQQAQQQAESASQQKRKRQASASPPGQAPRPAPAAAAQRSWAAVVAGPGAAAQQPRPAAGPPISSMPLWQQLRQQLHSEQQQTVGLRDHALAAAIGSTPPAAAPWQLQPPQPQVLEPWANGNGAAAAATTPGSGGKLSMLNALRASAAAERAAAERLVRLAQ